MIDIPPIRPSTYYLDLIDINFVSCNCCPDRIICWFDIDIKSSGALVSGSYIKPYIHRPRRKLKNAEMTTF